jgi:hypothetical protein
MKYMTIIFLIIFFSKKTIAQIYQSEIDSAFNSYRNKKYNESIYYYKRAFKIHTPKGIDLYNAACVAAILHKKKVGLNYLIKAIKLGFDDPFFISSDKDLQNLKETRFWKNNFLNNLNIRDYPLRDSLLEIGKADQEVRIKISNEWSLNPHLNIDSCSNIIKKIDSLNLIKVNRIIMDKGILSKYIIGKDAQEVIYNVYIHSDNKKNHEFFLDLANLKINKKNIRKDLIALIEDKYFIETKSYQKYGSQVFYNRNLNKYQLFPLKREARVNILRRKHNMESLNEYLIRYNIKWNLTEYKKEKPEIIKYINTK